LINITAEYLQHKGACNDSEVMRHLCSAMH